jgi:uncharacterized RDD family membrane protein YckC
MQSENPYQSPTEGFAVEAVVQADPSPASSWRRFANMVLDNVFCMIMAFIIGIVITAIALVFSAENAVEKIPDLVFGMAVLLIYFVPQEALWGRTLAKFITGTRVVSATGYKPTFLQIVGRMFCRMIPFEPFSFLFAGENPVGWHDKISNTRVICDR